MEEWCIHSVLTVRILVLATKIPWNGVPTTSLLCIFTLPGACLRACAIIYLWLDTWLNICCKICAIKLKCFYENVWSWNFNFPCGEIEKLRNRSNPFPALIIKTVKHVKMTTTSLNKCETRRFERCQVHALVFLLLENKLKRKIGRAFCWFHEASLAGLFPNPHVFQVVWKVQCPIFVSQFGTMKPHHIRLGFQPF